jgi:dolichol-phosphate mannosyltransferase
MQKVTLVIPTYNERENIKSLLTAVFKEFATNKIDGSVIVVDDNSPDGTAAAVEQLATAYPITLIKRSGKLGIGSAYVEGFKKALAQGSEIIFSMDADHSHKPSYIKDFLAQANDYDLIVGSRRVRGGGVVEWSWHRKLISYGGNWIGKNLAGVDVSDLTSGYRAYKKHVIESMDLDSIKSDGYAFQLETLARGIKTGHKIGTIPIIFQNRSAGKSKISKKDILSFFWLALKIRLGKI